MKIVLTIFSSFLLGFLIISFCLWRTALKQRLDPARVLKGILLLEWTGQSKVKISDREEKYIMKSSSALSSLQQELRHEGWNESEQMGSAHVFTQGDRHRTITTQMFTRFFMIVDDQQ